MPEIAATNNAWHDGDRAISHSHSGRGFYLAAVVPMFEKTVISAFDCLKRSSCVLHCRTVGVREHVRRWQHSLSPLQTRVGLAAEELAGAGAADELAGVDDRPAAGEDGFGRAFGPDAFEHGVVHAHVMGFRADDFF